MRAAIYTLSREAINRYETVTEFEVDDNAKRSQKVCESLALRD